MSRLEDSPVAGAASRRAGAGRRLYRALLSSVVGGDGIGLPGSSRNPAGPGRRRGARVSVYALVLALGVALVAPAAGFLAYVLGQQDEAIERDLREGGVQLVSDIADRLEQEFESMDTMLAVFASSGWLEAEELGLLHRRATRALAGTGRHLIVLDEGFDQLLNTRVPFGTPLGKTSNVAVAEAVLQSGQPAISDIFIGRVADAPVFNALRPVVLPDGRERVLILTRNARTLDDLVGSAARDDKWNFALLDGAGNLVSSHLVDRAAGQPAGQRAGAEIPASCRGRAPGPAGLAEDGRPVYVRLPGGFSWRVCVWPASAALASTGGGWTVVLGAAAAWIALAVVVAVLLSAMISRSIALTARIGALLGSGRAVPYVPSSIAEVDEVRRTLAQAGAERVRHDDRLKLLLREAAHRARNQVALAVSLVDLSSRDAQSAAELSRDLKGRLLALARSVDALTDRTPDTAGLGELVVAQLAPFVDDRGERLATEGGEVLISERAAQTLSLVLHELATNASKYGAWTQPDGTVTVRWALAAEELVLEWSEAGGPGGSSERQGFGTTLLETLIGSGLSGRIERSFGDSGFSCRIVLPRHRISPQPDPS